MLGPRRARDSLSLLITILALALCCLRGLEAAAAAASGEHAAGQARVPFTANKRGVSKGINPWALNVVLGSLALTATAVVAHMLRSKSAVPATVAAAATATTAAASAGAGAASKSRAETPKMVDGSEGARPPSL